MPILYNMLYNMILEDLKMHNVEYKEYITSGGFVSEEKAGYYISWVKKFERLKLSEKLSNAEMVRQFDEILRVGDLEDWQVAQARHAVELYLNMFLPQVEARKESVAPEFRGILTELKNVIRVKHYAYSTERTYADWVRRYWDYCVVKEIDLKDEASVKIFLTDLAVRAKVAAGTQNQAFNALLFLFKHVFHKELDDLKGTVRAKNKRNLPVVLSVDEVKTLFSTLDGTERLILELTYGTGMRVSEVTRLRVMNVDFGNGIVRVIDGKGGKDRAVPLPKLIEEKLKEHLDKVRELHQQDLSIGFGDVYLPPAMERKFSKSGKEWKWQYVFPSSNLSTDPRSGKTRRHHILDNTVQRIVKKASSRAAIEKRVTVHTLRHSFATHLLTSGVNIREIQELLGHKNVETTMIYTHVVRDLSTVPASPLDML